MSKVIVTYGEDNSVGKEMLRVAQLRAELRRLRKELEFIEGQLYNERFLASAELADLTLNDIDKLQDQNERLLTLVLKLEALLEE